MTQTVQEKKTEKREDEKKDNFFLELLHNLLVQLPIMAIGWVIAQFTSEG